MKKLFYLGFFLLLLNNICFPLTNNFDIVFDRDCFYGNDLNKIRYLKEKWGATGIVIWVNWGHIEQENGVCTWGFVDNVIDSIKANNLKLYVRVTTGIYTPSWAKPTGLLFYYDDFQIKKNGGLYFSIQNEYPLNFYSTNSKFYLERFLISVIQHLNSLKDTKHIEVEYIIPSNSPNGECEYTPDTMLGYSNYEIIGFQNFLMDKYDSDIGKLNYQWGSQFSSFSKIDITNFNWDYLSAYLPPYNFPRGRVDWMEFRTKVLKDYIDGCAAIIHSNGYKMGLDVGSFYDGGIEYRGWYDPVPLIENVDLIKNNEVIEYKPEFEFAADYLRSLSHFWSVCKKKQIIFSTESNWPGYPEQFPVSGSYPADLLSRDWSDQLEAFYWRGASAHFIAHWDWSTLEQLEQYEVPYANWRQTLLSYSGEPIHNITNQKAVHLSCEQGNFEGNGFSTFKDPVYNIYYQKFNFLKSIVQQEEYISNENNYDGHCDIVTSKMIEYNPTFLNSYSIINFTKGSKYISNKAYLGLMTNNVTPLFNNSTWFSDNGHGEFKYTQGLRNEYNVLRSPIHLIWRSRADLQSIWPFANLPAQNSNHTEDFICWAKNTGSANSNDPEYPGWYVYSDRDGLYDYDLNLRKVWYNRIDLQNVYIDRHNGTFDDWPINIISWATSVGYTEEPLLYNYNYWPYIGTIVQKNNIVDAKNNKNRLTESNYTLFQNYPNPFNPVTKIKFSIIKDINVSLTVYDALGREVCKLINNEFKKTGAYEILFDGTKLSSGIYYYRISTGVFNQTKKMMLIK